MEPVLRRALSGPCGPVRGERLLVAVSGGADSTALLLGLARLAPAMGFEVAAAHLNHRLRGSEADRDQDFVRALCEARAIPLVTARWNTRARMARRGLSGQDGLRRLRREFLGEAAHRMGARLIATGHTADDQLETLMLRLLRGAGLRGLGAIRPRVRNVIRPLLLATRHAIEADLRSAGIVWREDTSNRDPRYARSRVRHDVVPALLRALGDPQARRRARASLPLGVAEALEEVRDASALVERLAERLLARARLVGTPAETALDAAPFLGAPRVVQDAALRRLWRRLSPRHGLTRRHLEALRRLLASKQGGASLDLPGGRRAQMARGVFRIRKARPGIQSGILPTRPGAADSRGASGGTFR